MNILNALILTVFIAILIASSNAKISSTSSFLSITGGKSKPPSKSSVKSKKVQVKRSTKYDEDDDEDDEDDEDDYKKKPSKKTTKSTTSNKKGSKKTSTALISTTDKRGKKKSKRGGIQFPTINLNLNLKEKFDDLTKQGQSVYKDVYRRAKVCLLFAYLTYTPYFPLTSLLISP